MAVTFTKGSDVIRVQLITVVPTEGLTAVEVHGLRDGSVRIIFEKNGKRMAQRSRYDFDTAVAGVVGIESANGTLRKSERIK